MGVGSLYNKECTKEMADGLYLLLRKGVKEGLNLHKHYSMLSRLLKHTTLEEGRICSESSKSTLLLY